MGEGFKYMHLGKTIEKYSGQLKMSAALVGIGLVTSGCTSSGFSDLAGGLDSQSGKQAHAANTNSSTYRLKQLKPIANGKAKIASAYAEQDSDFSVEDNQDVRRSGVLYRSNGKQSANPLGQTADPIHTASLATPTSEQAYAPSGLTHDEIAALETQKRIENLSASMVHSRCKSGWGKQARKPDATRITPGHRYYIEIRMRHTPPLPVGHTYTAYGRLDANGNKLDESLVMLAPKGGYAGATVASTIAMPSVMTPTKSDCNIKPVAAYRVSLSDQQYENLLREIRQAKAEAPKYHLFMNNCNHFTSRISESVGIKTPKNKYTSSLIYIYDIMKENEGRNYRLANR